MTNVILETLRACVAALAFGALVSGRRSRELRNVDGWRPLVFGFGLILFGILVDTTENFPELNRFVIVGDTEAAAFLENVVGYLLGFVFLAVGVWRWLPKIAEHQKMIAESLEKAETKLNVLQGLLPICSSCKKIRDDKGSWKQIEAYITERSEAVFTHGVCPDCAEKLYPGLRERVEAKDAKHRLAVGAEDDTPEGY